MTQHFYTAGHFHHYTVVHVAYLQENPVTLEDNYFDFDAAKACLCLANWGLSLADTEKGKFSVTFAELYQFTPSKNTANAFWKIRDQCRVLV